MHRLADRRRVTLVTDPSQDRIDRYERLLAYAIRRGGLELNLAQLRRGWAEVYVYAGNPFRRVGAYRRAQRQARAARRGVWRRCGGEFSHAGLSGRELDRPREASAYWRELAAGSSGRPARSFSLRPV
jgi:endonuclease YncB( thermonuclease family)